MLAPPLDDFPATTESHERNSETVLSRNRHYCGYTQSAIFHANWWFFEGLRAIAVLPVCFHYGVPGLKGGFIGVDVFFVICGYLITKLLVNEISKTGTIDLWKFYGRRARRLLPAAWSQCSRWGLATKVLSPLEQKSLAKAAIVSSSYLSNV